MMGYREEVERGPAGLAPEESIRAALSAMPPAVNEADYRAPAVTAEMRIAEQLHELEGISSQVLTVLDQLREKSKRLYTSAEVGDAQTSEAELVSAPLKAENARLRQKLDELESLQTKMAPAEILTISDECVSVGRLTRQLDVALSQISALQRRNDQLGSRVAEMSGWLDLKTGELASANEQRDTAREQERRVRAAWQTEIERGRDLEADLSRLREELAQRTAKLAEMTENRDQLNRDASHAQLRVGHLTATLEEQEEQEATIVQLGTSLAEVRELAAARQRDLDTMADTLAGREDQIRELREALNEAKSVSHARNARIDHLNRELTDTKTARDSERRSKVHYMDRLATVERIVRTPAMDSALNTHATPPYAQTLAGAVREIREVLKG